MYSESNFSEFMRIKGNVLFLIFINKCSDKTRTIYHVSTDRSYTYNVTEGTKRNYLIEFFSAGIRHTTHKAKTIYVYSLWHKDYYSAVTHSLKSFFWKRCCEIKLKCDHRLPTSFVVIINPQFLERWLFPLNRHLRLWACRHCWPSYTI